MYAPINSQKVKIADLGLEVSDEVVKKAAKRSRSPRPGPSRDIEEELWKKGHKRIAGIVF